MAVSDKEIQYIVGRIRNSFGTAEGTLLPPPQKGQFRVPFITNFRLASTESFVGGTQFVLTFNAPETNQGVIDHFNIFITGLNGDFTTLVGPSTCSTSPATVRVTTPTAQQIIFTAQTVLKSGLVSDLNNAPTVTGTTIAAQISSSDIPNSTIGIDKFAASTPGAVNAYDSSGNPTLINPVASGRLLTSAGTTNPPTYQTKAGLDLVLGNSNLTTADSIIYVASSGTVTQLAPSTAGFVLQTNGAGVAPSWVANTGGAGSVQGAGNLTDVDAIPYVSASGTISDDPTNFVWDHTNHRLGIGTNAPSYPLDVRGDIGIGTLGKTLRIKEGSNATMGVATLSSGAVTVSTTAIAANSRVMLTPQNAGSTVAPGAVYVSARTAGTSFVITSTDVTDDRVVGYIIFGPF